MVGAGTSLVDGLALIDGIRVGSSVGDAVIVGLKVG